MYAHTNKIAIIDSNFQCVLYKKRKRRKKSIRAIWRLETRAKYSSKAIERISSCLFAEEK